MYDFLSSRGADYGLAYDAALQEDLAYHRRAADSLAFPPQIQQDTLLLAALDTMQAGGTSHPVSNLLALRPYATRLLSYICSWGDDVFINDIYKRLTTSPGTLPTVPTEDYCDSNSTWLYNYYDA